MNHYHAQTVHRDKTATFYAEAQGSRLAADRPRVRLPERFARLIALLLPKRGAAEPTLNTPVATETRLASAAK